MRKKEIENVEIKKHLKMERSVFVKLLVLSQERRRISSISKTQFICR